jgi:hypothetical protein
MPKITLLGAAQVAGVFRYPSEGPLDVDQATADELVAAGLAEVDALDRAKVDELRQIAIDESVEIGPDAKKADLIVAIRARRSNEA